MIIELLALALVILIMAQLSVLPWALIVAGIAYDNEDLVLLGIFILLLFSDD